MFSTLIVIFILQVIYVSLLTMRTILTIKGYRYSAAILSALDVLVYVIAFKIVLENLDKPINLIVYCVSYGIGILVGIKIEEKLALGYINITVITKKENLDLAHELRNKGYGVTVWEGEGMKGGRLILSIMIQRKHQRKLCKEINQIDPTSFVLAYEPKHFQGGFSLQSFQPTQFLMPKKEKAL